VSAELGQMEVFFFHAEAGIRGLTVTGVQTCALPIWQYCSAAEQYCLEHDTRTATFDQVVGPGKMIPAMGSVAGETYTGLRFVERSEERRVGKEWRSGCGAEPRKPGKERARWR